MEMREISLTNLLQGTQKLMEDFIVLNVPVNDLKVRYVIEPKMGITQRWYTPKWV